MEKTPAATEAKTASLYVGDLNTDVTEAQLFETFKEVGPVLSIRVCRDSVTRRSLGYAYLNFQDPKDAAKCLEERNWTLFNGRPCRLMWSQRNPNQRKNNRANIFIKSLHSSIDNKSLHDTFQAFGNILSCKVVMKPDGTSAGYGFVHFEQEESAAAAVEKVNGMLLKAKQVYVGFFERRTKRLELHKAKFTNIYVKHLATDITKEKLDEVFSKFGDIRSSVIMVKEDGTPKGFAFVNYEEHDSAVKAIDEMHDTSSEQNGCSLTNKPLYVTRHQKKSERQHLRDQWAKERAMRLAKYVNLYIKNLDDHVDDETLKQAFEPFGTIISAKVMRDEKSGVSKGFGFVSFRETDAANKAVAEMNGKLTITTKPMYVGPAQRKEERRLQLEMQFAQRMKHGGIPEAGGKGKGGGGMSYREGYIPGQGSQGGIGQPQMGFYNQAQNRSTMSTAAGPKWANPGMGMPMPMGMGMPMPMGGMGSMGMGASMGAMSQGGKGGGYAAMQYGSNLSRQQGIRGPSSMGYQSSMGSMDYGGQGQRSQRPGAPQVNRGLPRTMQPTTTAPPPRRMQVPPPPQSAPPIAESDDLTEAELLAMDVAQQKNWLGERLFSAIANDHPDLAAKITGMLLEMETQQIWILLHNNQTLQGKVNEALEVLKKHPEASVSE
uniref:Polyadenylate-binding protein n=1 Tax=Eutreptiella gymnastica TaxID=73025 RepID=A0A7S1N4A2_9EUGL|mmetsp:Transcript_11714/g.21202  ORF Transcript_11714/g.21202 Transcript_11714/m.21202 type:complete len:660 (+) Transcript_11714:210-2189(+)